MTEKYRIKKPNGLGGEVYDLLLRMLMSLEIAPGERVSIDKLARDLDVSQTPVREALSQLEIQGLITKVHLVGYRAAPQMTRKQFDDMCEVRLLLEPPAAAQAALRISDPQLEDIVALVRRMGEPPGGGDQQTVYNTFSQDDARLHEMIAAASGNDLLRDIIARQRIHLHLFRLHFSAHVTQCALVEHDQILETLRRRDPEAAAAAMCSHIKSAHARFEPVYGP